MANILATPALRTTSVPNDLNACFLDEDPRSVNKLLDQWREESIKSHLAVLFRPRFRNVWMTSLSNRMSIDSWHSMSDEEVLESCGKSGSDGQIGMVILSEANGLGLVSFDRKEDDPQWRFTDLMWELSDVLEKEGKTWESLTRNEMFTWYVDKSALGEHFTQHIEDTWNFLIRSKCTQLLRRWASEPLGFYHRDLRKIALECNLTHHATLSILSGVATLGGLRYSGARWMPELGLGGIIRQLNSEFPR